MDTLTLRLTQDAATIPNFKVVIYSVPDEAVYLRALRAIEVIDADLTSGRRHYRSRRDCCPLLTLDEAVRAILADDLAIDEPDQIYRFIEAYIARHRIPPVMQEIGKAFGLTNGQVSVRLGQMEALGWIKRDKWQQRSIVLMGLVSQPDSI